MEERKNKIKESAANEKEGGGSEDLPLGNVKIQGVRADLGGCVPDLDVPLRAIAAGEERADHLRLAWVACPDPPKHTHTYKKSEKRPAS